MKIPITQSKAWQKLQTDLHLTSFFAKTKDYQYLAILKTTPVGNYLYLPYGPLAKTSRGFRAALKALKTLAKEHQAIFLRLEPQNPDFASYLSKPVRKTHDLNPRDTWVLDLAPDQTTLLSNFSQGTRTRYNTSAKKGLRVRSTQDLAEIRHLVRLQQQLAKTKGIQTFSSEYLKTELAQPFATLYLVEYQPPESPKPQSPTPPSQSPTPEPGQIIAASLFFDYQNTRYYMQSATDQRYKKLPATVALLTQAIFDAKKQGIKQFDFWGIAPDGAPADHPWRGFTAFKQSFGGQAVHYAGTYDLILRPMHYRLYQIFRQINRLLRRFAPKITQRS